MFFCGGCFDVVWIEYDVVVFFVFEGFDDVFLGYFVVGFCVDVFVVDGCVVVVVEYVEV